MGVVANRGFILFDVHLHQWNKWRAAVARPDWNIRAVFRPNWLNTVCVANKIPSESGIFTDLIREDWCAFVACTEQRNSLMCFDQELLEKIKTNWITPTKGFHFRFGWTKSVFVSSAVDWIAPINLQLGCWKVGAYCLWWQGSSGRLWSQRKPLKCCSHFNIKFPPAATTYSRSIVRELSLRLTARKTYTHSRIFRYIHFPARRKINALCLLSSEQHVLVVCLCVLSGASERKRVPCAPFALTRLCNLIRHRSPSFPTPALFVPRKLFLLKRDAKLCFTSHLRLCPTEIYAFIWGFK